MAEPQNSPAEPLSAESDAATPVRPTTVYAGYSVRVRGDHHPDDVIQLIESEVGNEGYGEVNATLEEHAGDCAPALCGAQDAAHKHDPLFLAAQAWRDIFEARLIRGIIVYTDAEYQLWKAIYAAEGRPFPLTWRRADG